jgi:hypothetical protein
MFKQNKDGQLVYKQGRVTRGFITPLANNRYAYSFGKPSQSNYVSFECDSLYAAKSKFLSIMEVR